MVQNEILQGVVGELPFGWPTAPRLLVAEEDVSTARELLKMFEAERPEARTELPAENVCLACGAERWPPRWSVQCGWTFTSPSALKSNRVLAGTTPLAQTQCSTAAGVKGRPLAAESLPEEPRHTTGVSSQFAFFILHWSRHEKSIMQNEK